VAKRYSRSFQIDDGARKYFYTESEPEFFSGIFKNETNGNYIAFPTYLIYPCVAVIYY